MSNQTIKSNPLMGIQDAEVDAFITATIDEENYRASSFKSAGLQFCALNLNKRVGIGISVNKHNDPVAVIWDVDDTDEWLVTSKLSELVVDLDPDCPEGEPNFSYVKLTTANSVYYFGDPE